MGQGGVLKTGQARLMDLRKTMEKEGKPIIRYIDIKKKTENWKVDLDILVKG